MNDHMQYLKPAQARREPDNRRESWKARTRSARAFDELGLSAQMLEAVRVLGYESPTPVQARAILEVLAGRDLLAAGSDRHRKDRCLLLPTMDRLEQCAAQAYAGTSWARAALAGRG